MLILNNSLNEVTHGFNVNEFEDNIGATVREVKSLLKDVSKALDKMTRTQNNGKVDKNYFGYLR